MNLKQLIEDPKLTKRIVLLITYTVLLIFALFNLDKLFSFFLSIFSLASPFFIGIAIAFVVNVILKFYEEKVFAFLNKKISNCGRSAGAPFAWCSPSNIDCHLRRNYPFCRSGIGFLFRSLDSERPHINRLSNEIIRLLEKYNVTQDQINSLSIDWTSLLSKATEVTSNFMGSLFNITASVANGIFTMAMSFIFCMYMLFGKEKLTSHLKRLLYAFLPNRAARRTIEISSMANRIFSNFVRGQLTEACIWFFLVYIGLSILRLPYAVLISSIVALCSLIPIIGPYISMFTAGFILLLVNPWYTVTYIVFFLILQQIEGNLIYPRVVGTSIGLPPIWVLLSIILCGNLFGIVGILLGIPTFSVLYALLRETVRRRLYKKGLTKEKFQRKIFPEAQTKGKAAAENMVETSSIDSERK
ncbi:MAG: AI-2E family transporter [Anaeromassilibacillus sp.]